MNKLITSAGLVAVGATCLQAAYAPPGLGTRQKSKPYSFGAAISGFYDDNISTAVNGPNKKDSFGVNFRPSVALNLTTLPQTYIGASYVYGLKYYADRDPKSTDQSHEFDARLEHAFTERYKLNIDESFAYSQEPEILGDIGVPTRSDSSAYRNNANIDFSAQVTRVLGLGLGYGNNWYDYKQDGFGSRSALLDRFEHSIRFDTKWQIQPKLLGRIGYRYRIIDYIGDEFLDISGAGPKSDSRNNTSHTTYVGADYSVNARLRISGDAGVSITSYDSPLAGGNETNPYVDLTATYLYQENSDIRLNFSHDRTATDLIGTDLNRLVSDSEYSRVSLSVNHAITPRLKGRAIGRYTHGSYSQGSLSGQSEDFFNAALDFDFKVAENVSAIAGYNHDRLLSDSLGTNRSYSRNVVYLGVNLVY